MPKQKGNKQVMTEAEAKKLAESMDIDPPSNGSSSKSSQNDSNTSQSTQNSQGWWNEPIRHAMSAKGIQTTLEGDKELKTDYGSVFIPSDEFNQDLKDLYKELKCPQIKEAIKDLLDDVDNFEDLEDEFIKVIEDEIGSIQYKYQSQKERNQLVNGNFEISKEEYKQLQKTKQKIDEDFQTIKSWVDDLETDLETEKNDARNEFEEFAEKASRKISDDQKYRVKVQQKLSELVVDLNQKRADLKYGEAFKDAHEEVKDDVTELYQKAIKKD